MSALIAIYDILGIVQARCNQEQNSKSVHNMQYLLNLASPGFDALKIRLEYISLVRSGTTNREHKQTLYCGAKCNRCLTSRHCFMLLVQTETGKITSKIQTT